ncbi:flagellar hook-length control protein FliK [Sulfitobacter pseudonitzschiae]|uniref:flagellar hook-length control protein FliK n=1 Tax=Pseudosulfitobacter pseudonitzschiae TaxID=1402135 RepID=UPI001AF054F5|nr:flagellar hook-length control protein FliK [Pseudosulfitobacter pseudonitzschiae]MBM2295437.1 flagellar hook-length control protein FliK [Pseudosulfitobacter pseudonitzschiae]MBM2300349.1 flagellar hook-length control protein FliK [Pseudosulfitobacter pseudonitzschiae]MBM2310134.1 flagellar hook-length control protein FliK [Pseudosulfitobacter pseudonitzschiae]MBM2315046.1 flagellar hook-length control protein FliK [Pseudosulfitobacter pseudonitzschiae]
MQLIPLIHSGSPAAPRSPTAAGSDPAVSFAATFDQLVPLNGNGTAVTAQDSPDADADGLPNVDGATPEEEKQEGDEAAALSQIQPRLPALAKDAAVSRHDAPPEVKAKVSKHPRSGAESVITFTTGFRSVMLPVEQVESLPPAATAMPGKAFLHGSSVEGQAAPEPLHVMTSSEQRLVLTPYKTPQAPESGSDETSNSAQNILLEPKTTLHDGAFSTAAAAPKGAPTLMTEAPDLPTAKSTHPPAALPNTPPPMPRPATAPDMPVRFDVSAVPVASTQQPLLVPTQHTTPLVQATPGAALSMTENPPQPLQQATASVTVRLITAPAQPANAIAPDSQPAASKENVLPRDPADAPAIRQAADRPDSRQPTPTPVTNVASASPSQPSADPIPVDAAPDAILTDMRASGAPPAQNQSVTTPSASTHLHTTVARQIAEAAVQTSADRQIELTLNPAELGRVRMSLSTSDAGASVTIHADRPETLDLMRRNIGELESEFADMGYGDVDFAFSSGDGTQDQRDDTPPHNMQPSVEIATDPAVTQGDTPLSPDSAMDIRV